MAEEEGRSGALYVYGGEQFRYGVKDSADFPECFDLTYEEWDEKKREWNVRAELPGLDREVWEKLTLAVVHLQRWMEAKPERVVLEEKP